MPAHSAKQLPESIQNCAPGGVQAYVYIQHSERGILEKVQKLQTCRDVTVGLGFVRLQPRGLGL